ncbi:MAG: class II aldolase/adducin family protein [Helicobacteraceae bacterium]|jgi:rhamnose utilization protein RhaD (predicted bifunctional aldolase and dehydrogenase)|nr:class II aldolase/adducin family protein [Helicobacteraceae bacterium]
MKSLFDDTKAATLTTPMQMRVYTSQLLGQSEDLVLHGGGNTSYKDSDTLYVKGSGWNLIDIEEPGFAPVDLKVLQEMATRDELSDSQMVQEQRVALRKSDAPNPSIEAILHAIIPFAYVDHTHTDAIVTISNTPNGKETLKRIYGENVLLIDYVMPGFILSKEVYAKTQTIDWSTLEGIILLNHGLFTFDDDAENSYEKHIDLVTKAEEYITAHTLLPTKCDTKYAVTPEYIDTLTNEVSKLRGCAITSMLLDTPEACTLSILPHLEEILLQGELTPEHVIRIKPFPAVIAEDINAGLGQFVTDYKHYFADNATSEHICLDLAPRYAIIKDFGAVVFGKDAKEAKVISDIVTHTIKAMLIGEQLGGWKSLKQSDIFAMEYWELEQAKLKK